MPPIDAGEEEALARIPDLRVAQTKFLLSKKPRDSALKKKLLESIKKDEMGPFYMATCKDLGWQVSA